MNISFIEKGSPNNEEDAVNGDNLSDERDDLTSSEESEIDNNKINETLLVLRRLTINHAKLLNQL